MNFLLHVEEVSNKFLLFASSLSLNLDSQSCSLILVCWEAILSPVEGGVISIQGLDPVIHLSLVATLLLYFCSAFEEDHVTAEHLSDRVLLQSLFREGLCDGVAVSVS